ncbi:unnamed protein product [Cuscuta epithymum]|uniref:Retrotransposon gag domain-containing protein n=1 Tax=Cuscuta epithymum TaxID=186058 RepID=A0AAV0E7M2_9ASTE|nr:unnamed protein product [Cuscuta epithymum]
MAEDRDSSAGDQGVETAEVLVRGLIEEALRPVWARLKALEASRADLVNELEARSAENEATRSELVILKRALAAGLVPSAEVGSSKIKVPEPKTFGGDRNAKELENFLWDMEEYFKAAKVPDEEKVRIAPMYLSGDAKLWWRSRVRDDANTGRHGLESWDGLKKELKAQFLPHNVSWMGREALKNLKHTTSVRDYVKAFSSLMLDIENMTEEDRLFNFVSGLQPWAQTELRRQAVKDLPSAMAAAEGLMDYSLSDGSKGNKGKGESGISGSRGTLKCDDISAATEASVSKPKSKACWGCGGQHLQRNCPENQKLAALKQVESEEDSALVTVNPLRLV